MNGNYHLNQDDIGIDPTTVAIVDTLDDTPKPKQEEVKPVIANEPKKKKPFFKKLALILGTVALMGGVAFGVYFYLNTGKRKALSKPKFILNDFNVYLGSTLSDSIFDYGDFADIDVSGCKLDTSGVNTNKTGSYEYSMTCDKVKYTGNIYVIKKYDFEITANVLYKTSDDVLIASEFMKGSNDNIYTIRDNNVTSYLYKPGGPYYIEITLENEKENLKDSSSSVLYVTEKPARSFLTCTSTLKKIDSSSTLNYRIVDTFAFDSLKNYLNVPSRIYLFENMPVNDYVETINSITNGKVTLGIDITGYALRDDVNNTFRIAMEFDDEMLLKETNNLTLNYDNLKEYYENKGYTCE